MKKAVIALIADCFISGIACAKNTELFSYDSEQVGIEMSQLQTLENFVA